MGKLLSIRYWRRRASRSVLGGPIAPGVREIERVVSKWHKHRWSRTPRYSVFRAPFMPMSKNNSAISLAVTRPVGRYQRDAHDTIEMKA
jgi:hypothetical protein